MVYNRKEPTIRVDTLQVSGEKGKGQDGHYIFPRNSQEVRITTDYDTASACDAPARRFTAAFGDSTHYIIHLSLSRRRTAGTAIVHLAQPVHVLLLIIAYSAQSIALFPEDG